MSILNDNETRSYFNVNEQYRENNVIATAPGEQKGIKKHFNLVVMSFFLINSHPNHKVMYIFLSLAFFFLSLLLLLLLLLFSKMGIRMKNWEKKDGKNVFPSNKCIIVECISRERKKYSLLMLGKSSLYNIILFFQLPLLYLLLWFMLSFIRFLHVHFFMCTILQ